MYRLGPKLREHIDKALKYSDPSLEDAEHRRRREEARKTLKDLVAREDENKQLIDYETLSEIHKLLQRLNPKFDLFFYQTLELCKCVPGPKRNNPELEDRIRKLKCQQSSVEYNEMTKGLPKYRPSPNLKSASNMNSHTFNDGTIGSDLREMRPILISVVNTCLVIGGSFVFFYKAVEYSLPSPQIPLQVLVAIIGASIVAVAEFYFLIRIM